MIPINEMMKKKKIKIKDVISPFNGPFSNMVNPVFGDEIDPLILDIDFLAKHGDKPITRLVTFFIDEETGKIPDDKMIRLSEYLHSKYKRAWERYGVINELEYDPAKTFGITEVETLSGETKGKLTFDGTILYTGTDTESRETEDTHTKDGKIKTNHKEEYEDDIEGTSSSKDTGTVDNTHTKEGSIDVDRTDTGDVINTGTVNSTITNTKDGIIDVTGTQTGSTTNTGTVTDYNVTTKDGEVEVERDLNLDKSNTGTQATKTEGTVISKGEDINTPTGTKKTEYKKGTTTKGKETESGTNTSKVDEQLFGYGSTGKPKPNSTTTTTETPGTIVSRENTESGADTTEESYIGFSDKTKKDNTDTTNLTDTRTDNLSEVTKDTGTETTKYRDYKETADNERTDDLKETVDLENKERTSYEDFKDTTTDERTDDLKETRDLSGTESTSYNEYKEESKENRNLNLEGTNSSYGKRTGGFDDETSYEDYKETTTQSGDITNERDLKDKTDHTQKDERTNTQTREKETYGDMGVSAVAVHLRTEYEFWSEWNKVDAIFKDVAKELGLQIYERRL